MFPQPLLLIYRSIEILAEDSYTVLIVIELCIKKLRNDMGFAKLFLFATQGAYLLGHVDFTFPVLVGFVDPATPVFTYLRPPWIHHSKTLAGPSSGFCANRHRGVSKIHDSMRATSSNAGNC